MRIMPLKKIEAGFEVAKSIYNPQGNILIAKGKKLTTNNIKRLKQLGITRLYINIDGEPNIDIPELISQQERNKLVQNVKQSIKTSIEQNNLDTKKINNLAQEIILKILNSDEVIFHLQDIRNQDNYLFSHQINVAILSITIASNFVFTPKQLKQIATGALLHDVGLLMLNKEIYQNPSAEKHKQYKKHPLHGYNLLRQTSGISLLSAHIAYQHHEKLDGTGYPRNLKKDDIHEYAKLVAVANIYDKLHNPAPDNNQQQLSPHEALKFLDQLKGQKLKTKYVEALKNHIANYPLGTQVILNNGQSAIVTDVHSQNLNSPIVKILRETTKGRIETINEKDLLEEDGLWIEEIID